MANRIKTFKAGALRFLGAVPHAMDPSGSSFIPAECLIQTNEAGVREFWASIR
jgi:hypothetical protein